MASNNAIEEHLQSLPDDRRKAIEAVRTEILANLAPGFVETISWGMIAYEVPLETYPDTYNGKPLMLAALASQKRHMAVYLTSVFADPEIEEWFRHEYLETGKKLDMGKSCVRFRTLDQLPVSLVGAVIAKTNVDEFVAQHKQNR